MKSSSAFTLRLPNSFLIIGNPGTAKTTLALQLPKPFILDCDRNMDGPVRYLRSENKNPIFFYGTPYESESGEKLPRDKWFDRGTELLLEALNSPDVETIIIDSLTSFVQLAFAKTLLLQNKKVTDAADFKSLDVKFDYDLWGAFLQVMQKTIFWLKGSGKRIVFTAHIAVDKDEINGRLLNFINVPGQIKHTLSGWFEEVWQCYIETTGAGPTAKAIRKVRTVPDANSANLGLKTACGLGSNFDADMSVIMEKLNPRKA